MSKTTREIAKRLALELGARGCWEVIDKALRERDKRAERLVKNALDRLDALNAEAAEPMRVVLAAIRKDDDA